MFVVLGVTGVHHRLGIPYPGYLQLYEVTAKCLF